MNGKPSFRYIYIPTVLLLCFVSCGTNDGVTEATVCPDLSSLYFKDGRLRGNYSGVHIEIDPSIKITLIGRTLNGDSIHITQGLITLSDDRTESTYGTDSIEIANGELRIAKKSYGHIQKLRYVAIQRGKLKIAKETFYIGKKGYGPVKAGDKVQISSDGIMINNRPMGQLPPPGFEDILTLTPEEIRRMKEMYKESTR